MTHRKKHSVKKIGFYDSGLGGLFVMSHIVRTFPGYEYVFLADEKNLPYGMKSVEELYIYARQCLTYLIEVQKCDVVVIACNTLSATVYETLSQEYAQTYPDVFIIDVITPTIDALSQDTAYSIFGTPKTIESHLYKKEIMLRFPHASVGEIPAKELASLIEEKKDTQSYIAELLEQISENPHTCILACTHYGIVENIFTSLYPKHTFITQHGIMRDMLSFILNQDGGEKGAVTILSTKQNEVFVSYAREWFPEVQVEFVEVV